MSSISEILRLVKSPKRVGTGWTAHCPAHADEQPSLSISVGDDGRILLHCHAGCPTERIVQAMGLTMKDLFPNNGSADRRPRPQRPTAVYEYTDDIGNIVYRVVRYETEKGKEFKVYHREGPHWLPGMGDKKKVLYRLHDVVQAVEAGDTVFIVEGEKDVDRLRQLGLTATTNPFGAGKWLPEYSEWLKGANVVVIPDNDDVGRRHAAYVIESVFPLAFSTFLLELPDLPEHGDVSDWLNAGHTSEELLELAENLEPISDPARVTARLRPKEGDPALPPAQEQSKPVILLEPGRLDKIVDAAEQALISAGAQVFKRGTILQKPVVEEVQASDGRVITTAQLVTVTADMLMYELAKAAAWAKFDARAKKLVPADPKKSIAEEILARTGEWSFPAISGIITCPTLRRDGSVISEPGLDPATGLYFVPSVSVADLPENPTKDDALASLELLLGLLTEFPFSDEASKSVALSELITPVVRGALSAAPLHANTSPAPGTGKSYLCDLASAIAQGKPCPVLAASEASPEELDKKLTASALSSRPIFSLDNVSSTLRSDLLCQLIDRPLVEIRPLGFSTIVTVENRWTIFATGNNLTISGDLARRTIRCQMDADVERPETRTFAHKPFEEILSRRADYVRACLTIPRAYLAAGLPDALEPTPSFESWSNLVRSALVWLGCADPVDTMEAIREEDPAVLELRAVVKAWAEAFGSDRVTAKALVEAADGNAALREALSAVAGRKDVLDAKALAYWLRKQRNKVVGEWKITPDGTAHGGAAAWRLRPAKSQRETSLF